MGRVGIARWFTTMANRRFSVEKVAEIYLMIIEQMMQQMKGSLYTKTGTKIIKKRLGYSTSFMKDLVEELEY